MQEISYNRAAAVAYARRWALGRNPEFYDFSKLGGDCTNFASQCIYEGSAVMNFTPVFGWYYLSVSDRTPSWTGVEYLYQFLINNESVGPFAREVSSREVMPGDIVQLGNSRGEFYHTPVIVETRPRILVAAHSNDALNRPLSTYSYERARFLHIEAVRIW